jgi:arginine deiminase
MKYTLNNGWEVKKQENGTGLLHVTPLPNSIFNKEQFIIISEETMKAIEKGERDIHILFKKYNLHKQIIQWKKETYSKKSRINTPTKFYGKDFIVTQEGNKYFFRVSTCQTWRGKQKI